MCQPLHLTVNTLPVDRAELFTYRYFLYCLSSVGLVSVGGNVHGCSILFLEVSSWYKDSLDSALLAHQSLT